MSEYYNLDFYKKETFPIGHFVLWCKGWYRWKDHKRDKLDFHKYIEEITRELCWVLDRDGYSVFEGNYDGSMKLRETLLNCTDVILHQYDFYNTCMIKNNIFCGSISTISKFMSRYWFTKIVLI